MSDGEQYAEPVLEPAGYEEDVHMAPAGDSAGVPGPRATWPGAASDRAADAVQAAAQGLDDPPSAQQDPAAGAVWRPGSPPQQAAHWLPPGVVHGTIAALEWLVSGDAAGSELWLAAAAAPHTGSEAGWVMPALGMGTPRGAAGAPLLGAQLFSPTLPSPPHAWAAGRVAALILR